MAGSATGTGNIFEFNGHYYEVVHSQSEWIQNQFTATNFQESLDAAASMSHNGIQGHLATITSAEENQFITSLLTDHSLTPEGNYYTAGSDRDNEGTFLWIDGPETGENVEGGGMVQSI